MNGTLLKTIAQHVHKDNVERGFYDQPRELGTLLMLIVSELSEALEADRKNFHVDVGNIPVNIFNPDSFKAKIKDSFEDEIADAFIRLFDLVGYMDINIDAHIAAKLNYNKTRGYKHGKNY